jgi:membrane protein DedA with SNARE-associated domain
MEALIAHYGYLAVLVGTFLEGETVLILAGFAAHRGYLQLPWVIIAAFLGTLFGDQLFFYLGRRHSEYLLSKRPHWRPRLERAQTLIHSYRVPIILGFRFLYGLRTVTPFALGMSQVPLRLFVPLNVLGALIWAVSFGCAGYLFGQAMEIFLGDLKRYEYWLFAALAVAGLGVWFVYRVWWVPARARSLSENRGRSENPEV